MIGVFESYVEAIAKNGGIPVLLPFLITPSEAMALVSGILLTGGESPHRSSSTNNSTVDRDSFEFKLVELALSGKKPVLGICRGMQLLNEVHGGRNRISQDLSSIHRDYNSHLIKTVPNTRLGGIVGSSSPAHCHHEQQVESLGEGLIASAFSSDGCIEAIESVHKPVIGVHWHAEMGGDDGASIFRWLVNYATSR